MTLASIFLPAIVNNSPRAFALVISISADNIKVTHDNAK